MLILFLSIKDKQYQISYYKLNIFWIEIIRTEAMTMNAFLDLQQNTNDHQNDSLDCCLLVFRLFLEMCVYY